VAPWKNASAIVRRALVPHSEVSIVETNKEKEIQSPITDLPDPKDADSSKVAAQGAENVKGGVARRGGDDDDLEELQVER
jgi:hypothetical protein